MRFAITLVLLLAVNAWGQNSPPPVQDPKGTDKTQQNHQAQQTSATKPPAPADKKPITNLASRADDPKEEAETKSIKWTDEALALFNGLLVLVTAGLIVTGIVQWCETRETAKKQLRAYVALEDIYFPWRPNKDDPSDRTNIVSGAHPKVRIKNFGQTSAFELELRMSGLMAPYEGQFEREHGGRDYIGPVFYLAPTQTYATRVSPELFAFTPEQPVDSAKREPFIFGAIVYRDVFDRWWLNEFCYHYDCDPLSRNRFIPHSNYNRETRHKSKKKALDSLTYTNRSGPHRGQTRAAVS